MWCGDRKNGLVIPGTRNPSHPAPALCRIYCRGYPGEAHPVGANTCRPTRRVCVVGVGHGHFLLLLLQITSMSGLKLPMKMSVHYISFSAHADFSETSEFVDLLKPPHVVSPSPSLLLPSTSPDLTSSVRYSCTVNTRRCSGSSR